MIKAICRRTCWFAGYLYHRDGRYEFPDGTRVPRHFEVIGASSKPAAPKAEPKKAAPKKAPEKKAPPAEE